MRIRSTLPLALIALLVAPISYGQIRPVPSDPQANPQADPQASYPDAQPPSDDQDQGQTEAQAQQQQPSTSVARISLLQGNVSTQRGDTGDWNAASINSPVVPGDRVSTGERSRVELQLDYANILRLDSSSAIRVTNLEARHIQIEVSYGLVNFDSFPASEADVEIDTPNLAIHPQRDGVYRVEVNSDGETRVTVRRGQAEVGTSEGSTTLNPGQEITVRGDASSAQYRTGEAPARDGFDDWNENRDRTLRGALNSRHLSPYYTGSADLDQNGTWQNVPDYGQVWTPNNVPPDWAPYRDGSWVWEPGWGWTWVSYEPWGWAPYHYGRWFNWNGGWAWWPGPVYPYYRPLWAPAYVSFFGFGHRGFGFASFGWLPIGPCDSFFPWWGGFGVSFNFFRFGDHNHFRGRGFISPLAGPLRGRTQFSNLRGLESNARLRAGITSVSAERFGNGRVNPERRSFSAEDIRGAQFAHGGLPVTPGRGSLSATGQPAARGTVPTRDLNAQRFVSHNRPNIPQHSFAAESANVRQQVERQRTSGGSPRGDASRGGAGPRSSFAGENPGARAEAGGSFRSSEPNRSAAGAERSFAPSPAEGARPRQSVETENRGGWQRFTPQPQGQPGFSSGRGPQAYQNSPRSMNQGRQPLDLHKPIVQERSPYGGASRGPYGANPYSAPRSQPSYRAPEPPRGYSAAPRYSAPSAPRYSAPSAPRGNSGGANRGGGGSHSSGGGSHSGGGSSHSGGSSGGSHGRPHG